MFVGVQVTPWSKQLEAQHPRMHFLVFTSYSHHSSIQMRTQPLFLEVPTACSVACLLAANSWKNNCSWTIHLIMFSTLAPLPPSLWWLHASLSDPQGNDLKCSARSTLVRCVMTHGFDHKFRSIAIMTWNELKGSKMFKHPQLHISKTLQLFSFPSPWYKKNQLLNFTRLHHTPDSLIQASHWSKSYKYPKHCSLLEVPPSVQLFRPRAFGKVPVVETASTAPVNCYVRTLGI